MAIDSKKEGNGYGGVIVATFKTHPKSDSANQPRIASRPMPLNANQFLLISHVVNGTTTNEITGNKKTNWTIAFPTTLPGRYTAR